MLKYFSLPIGILIILSAACSRKYNPANTPFAIYHAISENNVRKLEKGITTPGDVVKMFGDPAKNSISDKGERYVYGYLGDTLTVNFDSSKTVSSFLYRPEIFTPVSGNTDNSTKRLKESRIKKIFRRMPLSGRAERLSEADCAFLMMNIPTIRLPTAQIVNRMPISSFCHTPRLSNRKI